MESTKNASAAAGAKKRDADFTVLMLGQRRAGKSSVLASMISSMQKVCVETNFVFRMDDATEILMRTRKSELEKTFSAFAADECFCTLNGMGKDGVVISEATNATVVYRFVLGLIGREASKKDKIVDFVDIRGEDIVDDFAEDFKNYLLKSSVIMIAVDAPALMEGRVKEGVGEFHDIVNMPTAIFTHITTADAKLREGLKKKEKLLPKLVMFVPLKCEKYYYEKQMGELTKRVKKGYANLLQFFESRDEYTVAITPILTMGDVVFDHYGTKIRGDGREVVKTIGPEGPGSMVSMPEFPMFRFRSSNPKFSPMFCEQPLLYLLAYISCILKKSQRRTGLFGWAVYIVLFGIYAPLFKGMFDALLKDRKMAEAIKNAAGKLKTSGDGYEVVYDRIGLKS